MANSSYTQLKASRYALTWAGARTNEPTLVQRLTLAPKQADIINTLGVKTHRGKDSIGAFYNPAQLVPMFR